MAHQCCSSKKGKSGGCMPNGKCCGGKNCGTKHNKLEIPQETTFSILDLMKQVGKPNL